VNGYETYKIYQALRLHFTTDYDAVKYNFKTAVKVDTFEKRRDRYFFEKLSRNYNREELIQYFAANLIHNTNMWIGEFNDNRLNEYISRKEKLTYLVTEDMKKMSDKGYTFDDLCSLFDNKTWNPLIEALRSDEIHIETVAVIDILVNFLNRVKSEISDPLDINKQMINLVLKYKLIMLQSPLPREKLKNKVLSLFTNQPICGNIDSVS
tara:strand:- start:657 stop:1283 length:627 start_codon:yes stop_codon:yes gene_type:complete